MLSRKMQWFASLLLTFPVSTAVSADPPDLVAVADPEVASRLVAEVDPAIPFAVLMVAPDDDPALLNQRALKMRNARVFVYEGANEQLLQAMFRERLVQQGVVAIDIAPLSRRRVRSSPVNLPIRLPALLATLKHTP
ncbi:hypothetical protein [Allorhodopirellula solitaria]|uniref:DUF4174 domain-containing protein n=1 Tax=Allorhodopirellula solitaria TaxID=2527987 RepID=A0A5C5YFS4_9BACT|nr:hypothetical protein [Allorhodopirellula solitaria]TWT73341.1 hypothetical protein CA85_18100 [Allorhodopirellula solitaria]